MIGLYREFNAFAAIVAVIIICALVMGLGTYIILSFEKPAKPAERPLTFEERWAPVKDLPPMIDRSRDEIIHKVRTLAIAGGAPAILVEDSGEGAGNGGTRPTGVEWAKTGIVGRTVPSPVSLRRRGRDICARHGMRKEITRGGKSWRCRR